MMEYMSDSLYLRLCAEIDRLIERYPESIEALEAVKWWGQEENIH